jgi:NADH dehydrogenase FAD-containing subunit
MPIKSLTPMNVLILGSGYAGLTVVHRIRDYSKTIDITRLLVNNAFNVPLHASLPFI